MLGIALAFLPALAAPAAAQEGRPEDVVREAIAAAGGADALTRFPAGRVVAKGSIFVGKTVIPVTVEQVFQVPSRSRTRIRTEPKGRAQEVIQIANGTEVWAAIDGAFIPATESAKKEIRFAHLLAEVGQLLPLLSDKRFVLKSDPSTNTGELAGVVVQVKGFPDLKLGFNRTTGHLVRIVRKAPDPDNAKAVEWEMTLGEHKVFDRLTRPTKTILFKRGIKVLELATESFIPLQSIDSKEFAIEE